MLIYYDIFTNLYSGICNGSGLHTISNDISISEVVDIKILDEWILDGWIHGVVDGKV